jgi:glucose/arabinose dehydrogenase
VRTRHLAALALCAALVASCRASAADKPASASPGSTSEAALVDIGAGLQGPAGLSATVYAQGVPKASAFAFDSEGRLWAASADYSDSGADGVYLVASAGATPIKVISGVHTPLGLLWLDGSLYVSEKGGVEAYGGLDGTSFARHATIVTLPSGTGEVNGIARAPDGRIWMGISAASDHAIGDSAYSAAVVSFLPDGSDLEVEASALRAPIGLAFYPGTSTLFVTMNQRDDLGAATPGDWLAIVSGGQRWGFPDCYGQGGAVCDGVPQPTAVLDTHAAVSGIAIVTGQLGSVVGTAAIVAEWAVGKLQRVVLEKVGSTYKGTVTPFLTGMKNPVAVALSSAGALFVSDWSTGIVYRIQAP